MLASVHELMPKALAVCHFLLFQARGAKHTHHLRTLDFMITMVVFPTGRDPKKTCSRSPSILTFEIQCGLRLDAFCSCCRCA